MVDKYLDPGFHYHLAVARIWGEVVRDIADSVIIPFDLTIEADDLLVRYNELFGIYGSDMEAHGIDMSKIALRLCEDLNAGIV